MDHHSAAAGAEPLACLLLNKTPKLQSSCFSIAWPLLKETTAKCLALKQRVACWIARSLGMGAVRAHGLG